MKKALNIKWNFYTFLTIAAIALLGGAEWVTRGTTVLEIGFLICAVWLCIVTFGSLLTRPGWRKTGCRVALPILTFTLCVLFARFQATKFMSVADALESFHDARKTYPEKLNELVPEYLSSVPGGICEGVDAHDNPMECSMEYSLDRGIPSLVYWRHPPFGRLVYRFGKRYWDEVD